MTDKTLSPETRPAAINIRFTDAGKGSLTLTARRRADGSGETFAVHAVAGPKGTKPVTSRGATQRHADFDAAKVAQEKLAAKAAAAGWTRRAPGRGFAARPDAFDAAHLPVPAKAPKR